MSGLTLQREEEEGEANRYYRGDDSTGGVQFKTFGFDDCDLEMVEQNGYYGQEP